MIVCLVLATILLFVNVDTDTPNKESPKSWSFSDYPNPFIKKPIVWTVPDSCHVEIIFYNVEGDVVDTFMNEFQTAGLYEKEWNPGKKVNGIYFYRMVICDDTIYKKFFI
jgi:hypothetical protein